MKFLKEIKSEYLSNILFIFLELKNITKLIKVSSAVQETTISILKPILQKWSKQKLSPNGLFYGMRRYSKGAWMSLHVDRLPSHIISVILQVHTSASQNLFWSEKFIKFQVFFVLQTSVGPNPNKTNFEVLQT